MDLLAEILEIAMLVCFGCSWPISVYKSIKIRTSVGKSAVFNILLIVGYVAGIVSKFLKMEPFMIANANDGLKKGIFIFALILYFLNLAMITSNVVFYYINKKLDMKKAAEFANTNNNAEVVENVVNEVETADNANAQTADNE